MNSLPLTFKETRMFVSTCSHVSRPRDTAACADGDDNWRNTIVVLEELLAQSIFLRDLYRNARWQTADIQHRRLRQLLDRHYQEQLDLVGVLIDRIRTLGGGQQIFAWNCLPETQFAHALRGNKAAGHLLNKLLDAHESVLNTGRPKRSAMNAQWAHDFVIGQVILTNDAQSSSISDQLVGCEPTRELLRRYAGAALDCE
jgi:starvation-inducible DNA-binding protein